MKATRNIGTRCITFTGIQEVEGLGTPDTLDVQLRYTGDATCSKGIALDNAILPLLTAAPRLLEALMDLASGAARVVESWESGDLAGAVRELDYSRRSARKVIDEAEGKA